jgi:oligopeptide/dipeptide ABC transporter ATP-binding protein
VSIQAQVVNLLQQLQREMGLSLIFIAHDLAVVKHISDRVLVMYLGHAVELGTYDEVYHNPLHPYTKALMSAVPIPDPDLEKNKTIQLLEGELPSPINPPSGAFSARVAHRRARMRENAAGAGGQFPTCGFLPEGRPVIISGADVGQPFFCEVNVVVHFHAARLRLYHLLFDQTRRSGRRFEGLCGIFALLSVLVIFIESGLGTQYHLTFDEWHIFVWLELFVTAVFTLEYFCVLSAGPIPPAIFSAFGGD